VRHFNGKYDLLGGLPGHITETLHEEGC